MDQPTQHIPHAPDPATTALPRADVPPPEKPKPDKKGLLRDPLSIVLVVVIVLALFAAGLAAGELYARHRADSVVADAIKCVTEDNASVSFAALPPFLWQHMTGDYQDISIRTAGNQIRSAKGMRADISISDVRLEGGKNGAGTIGPLDATITWPADGIKATVQQALPLVGSLVTDVKTNASDGTIELLGAFGSVVTKPQVQNRNLSLQVVSINALGFPLPPETVQSTLNKLTDELANNYPLNVRPDSVQVTDNTVVGHFSTQGADLPTGNTDPCFANL
jgi:hypothetical protein